MQIRFINEYKEYCIKEEVEGSFEGLNEFYEKNKKELDIKKE